MLNEQVRHPLTETRPPANADAPNKTNFSKWKERTREQQFKPPPNVRAQKETDYPRQTCLLDAMLRRQKQRGDEEKTTCTVLIPDIVFLFLLLPLSSIK